MGNRAVITIAKRHTNGEFLKETYKEELGVYIHWNGGRDSVTAFLKYCELKGYVSPEINCYGWARLCQVIGNFFGGTNSIGIDRCGKLDCDNYDNGVYLINNWQIVGRDYFKGKEQNNYDLLEMLIDIDSRQPKVEQLGEKYIRNEIAKESEQC